MHLWQIYGKRIQQKSAANPQQPQIKHKSYLNFRQQKPTHSLQFSPATPNELICCFIQVTWELEVYISCQQRQALVVPLLLLQISQSYLLRTAILQTLSYTGDFTHRTLFHSGNAPPHFQSYVHTFTFSKTDIRVVRGTTITNTVIGN